MLSVQKMNFHDVSFRLYSCLRICAYNIIKISFKINSVNSNITTSKNYDDKNNFLIRKCIAKAVFTIRTFGISC